MSKLLPCPFCGGEARMHSLEVDVRCSVCGAKTAPTISSVNNAPGAVAAWNRRAQPENSRQHALQTGVCPMCEDCPDGCPVEAPNDSRNQPENELLTLEELIRRCTPKAAELLKRGLFGAVKVCAVDETIDYGKTWLAYHHKPERSEAGNDCSEEVPAFFSSRR